MSRHKLFVVAAWWHVHWAPWVAGATCRCLLKVVLPTWDGVGSGGWLCGNCSHCWFDRLVSSCIPMRLCGEETVTGEPVAAPYHPRRTLEFSQVRAVLCLQVSYYVAVHAGHVIPAPPRLWWRCCCMADLAGVLMDTCVTMWSGPGSGRKCHCLSTQECMCVIVVAVRNVLIMTTAWLQYPFVLIAG